MATPPRGRPRRICIVCGLPVYGGHRDHTQDAICPGRTWRWQTQAQKRRTPPRPRKP